MADCLPDSEWQLTLVERKGAIEKMRKYISEALFLLSMCAVALAASADVTADFTKTTAKFRPALHSSGYAPAFSRAKQSMWDERIKEMNFEYVRTHDLALVNGGSRAFDVQYMFPLMHLDPQDPKNYYFATTDFMLDLQYAIGQKPFFRLGTSIEHTGLPPEQRDPAGRPAPVGK